MAGSQTRSTQTSARRLGSETELLLCCARIQMDAEHASRINALLQQGIDWAVLLRMAFRHKVSPLVYQSLLRTCPDGVPQVTLDQLRNHVQALARRNLLATSECLKLLRLFEAHEIPAIPYKGPLLAASIYGNLTLREFGDLDILVHERDYPKAQQLLMAHGFRSDREFEWESTFVDHTGRIAVDLHKRMTPREFGCSLDFDYLSRRLNSVVFGSTRVANLAPEDTLLMLAIQITKDAGTRNFQMAKVCDIAELLRAYPGLDFEQVLKQARKLGVVRILLSSLRLANNLLSAPLPREIVREMRFHSPIDELVEYARQQLLGGGDHSSSDQLTVTQFRWRVRERLRDKPGLDYRKYLSDVIVPSELDRPLLPLPRQLSFLYYFIRPMRLAKKFGLLLLRRARSSRDGTISK